MKWVVCLLLLFCFESLHTITITIGSGQLNNVPLPVDAYFNFSYSQVIYLQSEIQHAGVINRISYPYHIVSSDFLSNVNHLKVYMGLTSRTVFQSNTDWVSLDSLQLVFDGDWSTSDFSTTLPGDGWVTLPLTSYFNYDNTHNLVIAVDENQTGHVSMSDKFLCSPVTGARGLDCHSDIADIDPITPPPAALSNPRANIANIRINMITDFSEPMNPYPADGMTGVELVPHFSWSCNAESYALYMGLSTDQLVLKTDSLTTNTWTAAEILQPNTTYYWQVKAHYGPQIVNSGIWHFTSGALVGISLPFIECFDLNLFPPDQWMKMEGLYQQGTTLTQTVHGWEWGYFGNMQNSTNGAARLNIYGRDCYHWLISPLISGTSGTSAQISFRTRLTNWNSITTGIFGADDKFRIVLLPNSDTSLANAVILREWTAPDSLEQNAVITFTIPSAPFRIGFYGESTVSNQDCDLFLDDIRIVKSESASIESPCNLSAEVVRNTVHLNWNSPGTYQPLGYNIYRNYHYFGTNQEPSYIDTNANQGQSYSYFVSAVNADGQESLPSNSASLTCILVSTPVLNDSFESYPSFLSPATPWYCLDADQQSTFGLDETSFPGEGEASSFLVFNPQQCNPPYTGMHASNGNQFLAVFPDTPPPNNDWLIPPRLRLGTNSILSFMARSLNTGYGAERFRVGVSRTLAVPDSFTMISNEPYVLAPNQWTSYTYDLSEFDGMSVYIAIQCVSYDCCLFGLDEFKVISDGGYVGNEEHIASPPRHFISVFPNPFRSVCTIQWAKERDEKVKVMIFNIRGQKVKEYPSTIESAVAWDGRDERGNIMGSGVYVVKVKTGNKVISRKMVKF